MIEVLMLIPILLGAFFYNIKSRTQKADLPVLLGSLNWRATTNRLIAHHPPQTSPVILKLLRQKCLLVTDLAWGDGVEPVHELHLLMVQSKYDRPKGQQAKPKLVTLPSDLFPLGS